MNGLKIILQFVLIYFEQMEHTLRPDGQAGPALGQDTEKATKWAAGPETRLCDQIPSRNLHGNLTGFYKVFSVTRKQILLGGPDQETNTTWRTGLGNEYYLAGRTRKQYYLEGQTGKQILPSKADKLSFNMTAGHHATPHIHNPLGQKHKFNKTYDAYSTTF